MARGPARSYPHTPYVDRLDVSPYLQAGFNLNLADNWMDPPPLYDGSTWAAARLVAQVGSYPWTELYLHSLHLLIERIALPSLEMNPAPFLTFSYQNLTIF